MRRRVEIDRQQHSHLARGEVARLAPHLIEGDVVPEAQGLTRAQFGGHWLMGGRIVSGPN